MPTLRGHVVNVLIAVATAWAGVAAAETGEKVALRTADGRFVRTAGDGTVRPDRFLPGDEERFELRPGDAGHVSLKAANGRFLTAVDHDARRLRADSPRSAPADRETFQVVPVEGNRVALKARGYRDFLVFSAARGALQPSADKPRPEEIVEIFRAGEIRTEKSDDRLSLGSPELREAHVELQGLHLSNDLLDAAREPIEDIVNHELRHNQERIRQQANKSLAKAMKSREFHNPLLRFL